MDVAEDLRTLRQKRRLTKADVARRTGLHWVTVYRHEAGTHPVGADAAIRYGRLFNVSAKRFVARKDQQ